MRPPPLPDLLPLSILISTSLSCPISLGGGDESCGRAGGGEWSIVLWKKRKRKEQQQQQQNKIKREMVLRHRRNYNVLKGFKKSDGCDFG
jgi:hypothetical protein